MKLAVVGVTGLVGQEILKVMEERNFPFDELLPVASSKNVGKQIEYKGKQWTIKSMEEAVAAIGYCHQSIANTQHIIYLGVRKCV